MGVYYIAVNLDKEQYIDPHELGDGAKNMEWQYSIGGMLTALGKLLADPDEWQGDRIAIVPDGYEYDRFCESFKDISEHCRGLIVRDGLFRFEQDEDEVWDRVNTTDSLHGIQFL